MTQEPLALEGLNRLPISHADLPEVKELGPPPSLRTFLRTYVQHWRHVLVIRTSCNSFQFAQLSPSCQSEHSGLISAFGSHSLKYERVREHNAEGQSQHISSARSALTCSRYCMGRSTVGAIKLMQHDASGNTTQTSSWIDPCTGPSGPSHVLADFSINWLL